MKKFNLIIVIVTLFVTITNSFSQGNFAISLGASIPSGDFGNYDINDDKAMGAGFGGVLGLQYMYQITDFGLGIFGGIDVHYHGICKDFKDDIDALISLVSFLGADVEYNKYINIPISAGPYLTLDIKDNISLFAGAGATYNFFSSSDLVITIFGQEFKEKIGSSSSLGFKGDIGLILLKKIIAKVGFYSLGTHEIDFTGETIQGNINVSTKSSINMINVTAGYVF